MASMALGGKEGKKVNEEKIMTDRIHSVTVVLDRNIRVDDAEHILNAIRMIKHVISAEGNVADLDSHMAESRARTDLHEKLFEVIYPKGK